MVFKANYSKVKREKVLDFYLNSCTYSEIQISILCFNVTGVAVTLVI